MGWSKGQRGLGKKELQTEWREKGMEDVVRDRKWERGRGQEAEAGARSD